MRECFLCKGFALMLDKCLFCFVVVVLVFDMDGLVGVELSALNTTCLSNFIATLLLIPG